MSPDDAHSKSEVDRRRSKSRRRQASALYRTTVKRRPRRGYSAHGVRFADVTAAFAAAERELGTEWQLAGRGHCRRVTLDARYVRHAAAETTCWVRMVPHGTFGRSYIFPLAIVRRAAEILKVKPELLIGSER